MIKTILERSFETLSALQKELPINRDKYPLAIELQRNDYYKLYKDHKVFKMRKLPLNPKIGKKIEIRPTI